LAVRAKGYRVYRPGQVRLGYGETLVASGIPQFYLVVFSSGSNDLAAGMKCHRVHFTEMTLPTLNLLTGRDIPGSHSLVVAGGDETSAVRTKRQTAHLPGMFLDHQLLDSGGKIPQPDRLIKAFRGRELMTVRAIGHVVNPPLVSFEHSRFLTHANR